MKDPFFVFCWQCCVLAVAFHDSDLPVLPAVAGPVVNGIDLSDPGWADQPLVKLGLLDVTVAPFGADSSGKKDATVAIQKAIDMGRRHYLTVYFPSGTYKITETIKVLQPEKMFYTTVGSPNCNNMHEVYHAEVKQAKHCARTAPVVMQGSAKGNRPKFVVPANSGLSGPVVQLHNPINDNINMNQEFVGIDIHIEDGNPDAVGIVARGAQGVSVQDVTIYAGNASIGLEGGAGSGGSHINVTVIGGRVGMKVGSAQPGPTLTGITLIDQLESALVYQSPGRQTLTVTALRIVAAPEATGPAISAGASISITDSRIDGAAGSGQGIVASSPCSIFMNNVWVKGFNSALVLPDMSTVTGIKHWLHFSMVAASATKFRMKDISRTIYINGTKSNRSALWYTEKTAPPQDLCSQHLWPESFPTWETPGACVATDYGAHGDFVTDDTAALQNMINDSKCHTLVIPKGYFAVTSTLVLPQGKAMVGIGLIFSNIVPHLTVSRILQGSEAPWPLLRTQDSGATVAALSLLVWRHMNTTYAFDWQSMGGLWRRAHINRVDLSPGEHLAARWNQPMSKISGHGGGRFYNFYQENWDYQGPKYRHLLLDGTDAPWSCYHCNTEHSEGEANLEIRGARAPVKIHGFKGEGNYVQIWVSDSADFTLSGYGGNASPFPDNCYYPPGYAPYTPSILRIERTPRILIANIDIQSQGSETKCGVFNTGFAGSFYDPQSYTVLFVAQAGSNMTVPPGEWPLLYTRSAFSVEAMQPKFTIV